MYSSKRAVKTSHYFCTLTPAPCLRCLAGGPGRCDSGTVDLCPSLTFSGPTPQPGCAATCKQTKKACKKTFLLVLFLSFIQTAALEMAQHSERGNLGIHSHQMQHFRAVFSSWLESRTQVQK